jgi:hypothetical protein
MNLNNESSCYRDSHRRSRSLVLAAMAISLLTAANSLGADEVTKWNEVATRASYDSGLGRLTGIPLFEARVYAITFAAVHDALNRINKQYSTYVPTSQLIPGASPDAAVATAAHSVLVDQFNQLSSLGFASEKAFLDAAYDASLALIPDGPVKSMGVSVGNAAASAVLTLRAGDGWNTQPLQDSTYPQGTAPGQYRFTPGYPFALLPQWGSLPAFVLKDGTQFQPPAPYPVNSKRYAQDYNEIKPLGGDGVTTLSARTADETEIALFWAESSPLMWNRIGRTVLLSQNQGMWENARLLALLNLGLADGYISSWSAKFLYNYWRPVTAIREGDMDGNDNTAGDPNWTPLLLTPPIPDYDSGHAVQGGLSSTIMQRFFHTDRIAFAICSTTLPVGQACDSASPRTRSFSTFSDAADENGLSRILVGIHFRHGVEEGIKHGQKIGDWVVTHALKPVGEK